MTDRPVAQSLFPDIQADKPVGPLPLSVQTGTNADLMWVVRDLYLIGSVLDVTYGRGGWWQRFTPDPFTFHDLALDGVDFRALPEADSSVDAVVFDPPYVPQGGTNHRAQDADWGQAYGLTRSMSQRELDALLRDGLTEAARVASRWVITKCCDYVNGTGLTLGHVKVLGYAADLGLTCHDLIVHNTGPGPCPIIWNVKRCRRAHSYLLVFAVPA